VVGSIFLLRIAEGNTVKEAIIALVNNITVNNPNVVLSVVPDTDSTPVDTTDVGGNILADGNKTVSKFYN